MMLLVLVLSAIAIGVTELRIAGIIGEQSTIIYALVVLNILVAIAGCWTRQRYVWLTYLVASGAGFLLISAATPVSGALILARVIFRI